MPRTSVALPFSGTKLRALRERQGMRQQDLTDKTVVAGGRIPCEDISRYETGKLIPSAIRFGSLVRALGCEPDDLLDADVVPAIVVREDDGAEKAAS